MTEDTLRNALEVLDSGAAMAEWEGADESDRRSRQRVLDRLRKKLESPQGPLKTVKRPKPKKFKYKIGDVIAVRFVPELAEQNPDIESYCNKYFMVQVVGYTDYPTSLSRHPLIEQCGGVVALDWMGDTIPDMEEFAKAPMLDLTVLWWPIRSFACALPGFVDSKNEEKTERNAGYLVVSHSGGGMLRQGTRKGIRRTPANRGMRAHRIVKSLDISEDVCHGLCP